MEKGEETIFGMILLLLLPFRIRLGNFTSKCDHPRHKIFLVDCSPSATIISVDYIRLDEENLFTLIFAHTRFFFIRNRFIRNWY